MDGVMEMMEVLLNLVVTVEDIGILEKL